MTVLSEVFREFLYLKDINPKPSEQSVKRLIEVVGDLPVEEYTRDTNSLEHRTQNLPGSFRARVGFFGVGKQFNPCQSPPSCLISAMWAFFSNA